jgi:hypothetical protein
VRRVALHLRLLYNNRYTHHGCHSAGPEHVLACSVTTVLVIAYARKMMHLVLWTAVAITFYRDHRRLRREDHVHECDSFVWLLRVRYLEEHVTCRDPRPHRLGSDRQAYILPQCGRFVCHGTSVVG